jgi:MazG family protein
MVRVIKAEERVENGDQGKGMLDSIPKDLPALSQADAYQRRAARVGFDWKEIEGVLDKIVEEIEELKRADDIRIRATEMGDLFFSLVNLARWQNIDPESELRTANMRFKIRFSYIEKIAKEQGRELVELTLDEMDDLWEKAKGQ